MAVRVAARRLRGAWSPPSPTPSSSLHSFSSSPFLSRVYSTSGKVLSEEERAAENIFIKKLEKEKLEKLAGKGTHPDDKVSIEANSGETSKAAGDLQPEVDNTKNIAFAAALVASVSAGLLLWSSLGKKEEKDKDQLAD